MYYMNYRCAHAQRVILGSLLIFLSASKGYDVAYAEDAGALSKVSLAAEVVRPSILICEPLVVCMTVSNNAEQSIWYAPCEDFDNAFGNGTLGAAVCSPGKDKFVDFIPPVHSDAITNRGIAVQPGSSRRFTVCLLKKSLGPNGFFFDESGEYRVKLSLLACTGSPPFPDSRALIEAVPVAVEVLSPNGRDAEALVYWRQGFEKAFELASCGLSVAEAKLPTVEYPYIRESRIESASAFDTLRSAYSDTRFGQYCRFFNCNVSRIYATVETRDKSGFERTIEELRDFIADSPDFPMLGEALWSLGELLLADPTGAREAAEVASRIQKEMPDSPAAEKAREMEEHALTVLSTDGNAKL